MAVIRSIFLWITFVSFSVIWFVPIVCSIILPPRKRHKVGIFWNATFVFLIDKIVGLKYEVEGLEHVPNKPTIICCKHQSGYETLALQKFLPDQVFIIKKELLWFPILGISLYIMNSIPINRNQKSPETMQKLINTIRTRKEAGFWINIFPEGTRIPPGKKGKYRYGAANIAQALEMDILPIATNSGEFWPKGLIKYPGKAKFIIGPPIPYTIGDSQKIMSLCEEWIEAQQITITGHGPLAPNKVLHVD